MKLRELEESLLNKISAVQGAILDDDSVINSLESIKAEASQLNNEVKKTAEVIILMFKSIFLYLCLFGYRMSTSFITQRLTLDMSAYPGNERAWCNLNNL